MKFVPSSVLLMVIAPALWGSELSAERHFRERVQPLLTSRCIGCHGPEKAKGSLRLDSRDAVLKGGESGSAIQLNDPERSLLLQAVLHSKKELEMPPNEKLTPRDVAVLERWIRDGAPWPREAETPTAASQTAQLGSAWDDPHNPIARLFGGQRLDLWSLRPVQTVAPPSVRQRRWVRNPIDQFILARLESMNLAPSLEAERRTLARRVAFDLTGLPLSPAALDQFLADERADAYEQFVNRLLDTPAYGEHWARVWLDVVRYSDSNGFDWDEFRPRAWRFRDYVIRSLNADKPFNQFIEEQLAGDELLAGPPRNAQEQDALIATGYLRLGPQDNSAASFNEQERSRAELMADLVDTTGGAFLGLTLSCCRCHDHKYDPLSQADHYRLRSFFEPVQYADELPLDLVREQVEMTKCNAAVDARLQPLVAQRNRLLEKTKEQIIEERRAKLSAEERAQLDTVGALAEEQKSKREGIRRKVTPSDKEVRAALTGIVKTEVTRLETELSALMQQKRQPTLGLLMTDTTNSVPLTRVLFQGDYRQPKEPVAPGFLSVLDANPARLLRPVNPATSGRRLTLARWIAARENPLTARVLVNRAWQGYFGRGLVATPNDFGLAGGRPSHPELLDWLADSFMRDGWSLKTLHRRIATSATYRQSSRGRTDAPTDPDNQWYHRQNPRRLAAEPLRDSLLVVSGLLTNRMGGPAVWPELPKEVLQANPAFLDDNAEKTKGWYASPPGEQWVRSIYLVQKRTVHVPFLETFDLPENSTSCGRRNVSVVAPQALSLLNSALTVSCAKALAERVRSEAGTNAGDAGAVARAFLVALQRWPSRDELERGLRLCRERSLVEFCRALLNVNEFVYID